MNHKLLHRNRQPTAKNTRNRRPPAVPVMPAFSFPQTPRFEFPGTCPPRRDHAATSETPGKQTRGRAFQPTPRLCCTGTRDRAGNRLIRNQSARPINSPLRSGTCLFPKSPKPPVRRVARAAPRHPGTGPRPCRCRAGERRHRRLPRSLTHPRPERRGRTPCRPR
jgi:hypothetical protein